VMAWGHRTGKTKNLGSIRVRPRTVARAGVSWPGVSWCLVPPIVLRVVRVRCWLVWVLVTIEGRPLDVDGRGFDRFIPLQNWRRTARRHRYRSSGRGGRGGGVYRDKETTTRRPKKAPEKKKSPQKIHAG
jgi:hypothetical protein